MNWNWGTFAIVLIIAAALRLAGLISDFWMGLAIAAILMIFVLLQQLPAGVRKWSTYLLIGWLIFQFGPAVYNIINNLYHRGVNSTIYVKDELPGRRLREDLRWSEILHASGLSALDVFKEYSSKVEEREGARIRSALDSVHAVYLRTYNFQTLATSVDSIEKVTKSLIDWRNKRRDFLVTEGAKLGLAQKIKDFLGIDTRVVFWGLLTALAAGFVLSYILRRPWIRWAALTGVVIVAIGLIADGLIWGGWYNPASASSAAAAQSSRAATTDTFTVTPNWTPITLQPKKFDWMPSGDIEFRLADGRVISVPYSQNRDLGKIPGPIGPKTVEIRGTSGILIVKYK